MTEGKIPNTGRRGFIMGAVGTTVAAASVGRASSEQPAAVSPPAARPKPDTNRAAAAAKAEFSPPQPLPALGADDCGSDFMVDGIKKLGLEFVAAVPGDTFRGLQESLVSYGGNKSPEWLTCTHESVSVGIAHGYARASGKPMAAMMKSTIGLQNAAMAVYNAFVDRVPIMLFSSTETDGASRKTWFHSAQDNNAIVRDCTKWDDTPASLQHFADSLVRAYAVSTTPVMGPVLLSVDKDLQERPLKDRSGLSIPPLTDVRFPVGDDAAIKNLAKSLIGAEFPVILTERYSRTEKAMPRLVELAELLGAAVVNGPTRLLDFPTDHPLNQSFSAGACLTKADVLLALEPMDLWSMTNAKRIELGEFTSRRILRPDAKVVTISFDEPIRSNYQDFGRYAGADETIRGDAEATVAILVEEVKRLLTNSDRRRIAERRAALADMYQARMKRDRAQAVLGWKNSPITTARLTIELWHVIKGLDWVLSSLNLTTSFWAQRLWPINKHYQATGSLGAGGMGDGVARSIGAALHHRGTGRIIVNIQSDGDLMFTPGALWTAAHHKLPILTVVHNNRAFFQEAMEMQVIANQRNRNVRGDRLGCMLGDPSIDFAKMAQSMGVWAEGPIEDPERLAPALKRAVEVVKAGNPALVDVVSEPR